MMIDMDALCLCNHATDLKIERNVHLNLNAGLTFVLSVLDNSF